MNMLSYRNFAIIIKNKRIKSGMTQKEMAHQIPISHPNYCKIENGKIEPSFVVLQRICILLDIDLTKELKLKTPSEHIKMFD